MACSKLATFCVFIPPQEVALLWSRDNACDTAQNHVDTARVSRIKSELSTHGICGLEGFPLEKGFGERDWGAQVFAFNFERPEVDS